jgi:hypothetical protein
MPCGIEPHAVDRRQLHLSHSSCSLVTGCDYLRPTSVPEVTEWTVTPCLALASPAVRITRSGLSSVTSASVTISLTATITVVTSTVSALPAVESRAAVLRQRQRINGLLLASTTSKRCPPPSVAIRPARRTEVSHSSGSSRRNGI